MPKPLRLFMHNTLPKTGTAYPQIVAAGLGLALVGLSLARKAR